MMTNVYQVVKNGNEFVFTHFNKKPALRKALALAKNSRNYVELWYYHGDGSRTLINFWN